MSSLKKGKDVDTKKFFCTEDKMMYEHAWEWAKKEGHRNIGEGDALWRTGLAYIAWKDPEMKEGILGCYRKFGGNYHFKKEKYQASRATGRHGEDDVSRDQVIMSLAALHVNEDYVDLEEIAGKLPYKLSRRFIMTPGMWSWVKLFAGSKWKKFHVNFVCLNGVIGDGIAFTLNKIIAKICGFKRNKVKNNKYTSRVHYDLKEKWNKFQLAASKAYYHGFAFHLTCWTYYTLPQDYNPILKKIWGKMLINYCEEQNFLCRLLLGDTSITKREVTLYRSREGFRWQAYLDGSWPNYNGEKSKEWQRKYLKWNQLDKDCLITMYNKINKNK